MSHLFGPMRQVGIVVRDIEKAMHHWVEVCGIGPWFYAEQLPLTEFRYKGRVYDIKMSVALANSGDVQLELIQQRCDSPSLYRDFLVSSWGAYTPTFWDWSTYFGTIGLFMVPFLLFIRLFPVIAIAETKEVLQREQTEEAHG